MPEIITELSLDGVGRAAADLDMHAQLSTVELVGNPCVEVTEGKYRFVVYIQERQSLCFQAQIQRPTAGSTDISGHWNLMRRFARVIPISDGYLMRSEIDISHGVTRKHLRAVL